MPGKSKGIKKVLIKNINFILFCIFILFLLIIFIDYHLSKSNKIISTPADSVADYNLDTSLELPELRNIAGLDIGIVKKIGNNSNVYTNIWGMDNYNIFNDFISINYPKGSYKPSEKPIGGAGFIQHFSKGLDHARLSYTLKFNDNFDFVKGGKLPGLCGGTCSRGGSEVINGFSTRFMWRESGELEIYAYTPDKTSIMGRSLGRGMFQFLPGVEYNISQELLLNTPGKKDGILIVKVDGEIVYENTKMIYRTYNKLNIDAFLFSTFFGGGDISWASKVDTGVIFKDFLLEY